MTSHSFMLIASRSFPNLCQLLSLRHRTTFTSSWYYNISEYKCVLGSPFRILEQNGMEKYLPIFYLLWYLLFTPFVGLQCKWFICWWQRKWAWMNKSSPNDIWHQRESKFSLDCYLSLPSSIWSIDDTIMQHKETPKKYDAWLIATC